MQLEQQIQDENLHEKSATKPARFTTTVDFIQTSPKPYNSIDIPVSRNKNAVVQKTGTNNITKPDTKTGKNNTGSNKHPVRRKNVRWQLDNVAKGLDMDNDAINTSSDFTEINPRKVSLTERYHLSRLWLAREENTKYLVITWFSALLFLGVLLSEVGHDLEDSKIKSLIFISVIVFVGFGGIGLVGGILLIKRTCMEDPLKEKYTIDDYGDSRGSIGKRSSRMSKSKRSTSMSRRELPGFYPMPNFSAKNMHKSQKWQNVETLKKEIRRLEKL